MITELLTYSSMNRGHMRAIEILIHSPYDTTGPYITLQEIEILQSALKVSNTLS